MESIFEPTGVDFVSLRVNFMPVEVDFWSVIGGFRLRSSNFEPLGIDFRCLEVKLGILVVLSSESNLSLCDSILGPWKKITDAKVHFGPL